LKTLKGKKVLDLACGKKASLVYFLRKHKVKAEGIDPEIEEGESFLIKQAVYGVNNSEGKIPRKDKFYDYIFAHSNLSFKLGLSSYHGREPSMENITNSIGVFLEVLRVLKSGGEFVCWPSLNRTKPLDGILGMPGFQMTERSSGENETFILDTLSAAFLPDFPEIGRHTVVRRK